MGCGQRKYRRNIFLKLRALGYMTKAELQQFKGAIQRATWNRTPFKYPESLIIKHCQAMGIIKAKKKTDEVKKNAEKTKRKPWRPRFNFF